METGAIYICPTPIGNLEDITLRSLRILKEVDLIAAEDTRRTVKLLNHYEIKKPLISYHEYNKQDRGTLLIEKLNKGKNIALVSDAGMPGISDPGEDIINLAIDNGIQVICLPGPTASITGLVISGLSTDKFVFEGFLPSKKKARIEELEKLKNEYRTIIFYESPHRLTGFLKDLAEILGNRRVAISRELTKIHEETFRGTVNDALKEFEARLPKGEFVIVVEGGKKEKVDQYENITLEEHIESYINEGYSRRDAVDKVARARDIPRNLVYKASINREK